MNLLLIIFLSIPVQADDWWKSTSESSVYETVKVEDAPDPDYGNDSEYYIEDGYGQVFEFEDYHICQYCETEIIY